MSETLRKSLHLNEAKSTNTTAGFKEKQNLGPQQDLKTSKKKQDQQDQQDL